MSQVVEELESVERPKLTLQPRTNASDVVSSSSVATNRPSPFGAARPREQVIAEREGKKEKDVFKEQANKEWKQQVVLTEAQLEEKKAAEAELSYAKAELEKETDAEKAAKLTEEIALKENNLEQLVASLEKLAPQPSQTVAPKRVSEKKAYPGREGETNFGNFRSRGRDAGGEKSASAYSYGDTWGGGKKSGGQSECYNCGEVGHFVRECPRGGGAGAGASAGGYSASPGAAFGGGRNGSRACYSCGQSGHLSRNCPQSGVYGSRGGYGYMGSPYSQGEGQYESGNDNYYRQNQYGRKENYNQGY